MTAIPGKALITFGAGEPSDFYAIEVCPDKMSLDEALVRFKYSGICHTDQAAWNGDRPVPLPVILGHESLGVIEKLQPGYLGDLEAGDTVIASFDSCGECPPCKRLQPYACTEFVDLSE